MLFKHDSEHTVTWIVEFAGAMKFSVSSGYARGAFQILQKNFFFFFFVKAWQHVLSYVSEIFQLNFRAENGEIG